MHKLAKLHLQQGDEPKAVQYFLENLKRSKDIHNQETLEGLHFIIRYYMARR
jgi:hypothetical protein